MRYITALTTPHIEQLLQMQQLQMQVCGGWLHQVRHTALGSTMCDLYRKLYLHVLMAVK